MAHTDTEEKGYIYRDSIYWGGVVGGLGDQDCGVDLLIERGLEERGLRGEELTLISLRRVMDIGYEDEKNMLC